jgi:formyltetrahydrofolate synthetase
MTCGANPDGHTLAREEAADVELAAKALRPITAIADELGLEADDVEQYGRHAAKIRLSALDRLSAEADGKLVCVTAVTPTKAGEGKTTSAISLVDALCCLDMDDRALRRIVVGLGGRANGAPREMGFDITAASEVMAIVAVSEDYDNLRRRLGAITVAANNDGEPVTAERLGAAGSMAVLLVDALKPNLVQTLEGRPALVHCGPFANIAHGNNSVVADRLALKLGDFVVTESGFGADMGFEKFVDIVCRTAGLRPAAVVLVATVQALKHHGGDPEGGLRALERGAANLEANIRIVRAVGIEPVVAVNRFPGDSKAETDAVRRLALEHGAFAAEVNNGFEGGGEGAAGLAEAVKAAASRPSRIQFVYANDDPLVAKLEAVARKVDGAAGIELTPAASRQAERLDAEGLGRLPICMAKTHLSLSHDPTAIGAPNAFTLPIRELRPYTEAGWIVALCGEMQTMPGLPSNPAALRIDLQDGAIRGLGERPSLGRSDERGRTAR